MSHATGRGPTNWAGNVSFRARHVHRPTTVAELVTLIAGSDRIRALGSGHSFSAIADTTGDLVSVAGLPADVDIDTDRRSVRVAAGMGYGHLARRLAEHGQALHNLGSLPHISIAGACATGTHGSGVANGSLATAVSAIEMVTATGEMLQLSRRGDPDRFPGAVVSLGSVGVATHLVLDIEPAYEVAQYVYDDLPGAAVREHFDDIMASAYSVSLFTDWRRDRIAQVWLKHRLDSDGGFTPPPRWLGGTLADGPRHPLAGMPAVNCTQQGGVPGPWYERLPHFRLGFTPSAGEELQSEYLLARPLALQALDALDGIRDRIAPVLQVSEIRTVAADGLWLSPSQGRDTVAFHFTWVKDVGAVAPVVGLIERVLAPLDARPHWGKVFSTAPEVIGRLYDRLPEARRLRAELDPQGTFGNDFVDTYLGPSAAARPGR